MKSRTFFTTLVSLAALSVLLSADANAKLGSKRPLEQILTYEILGISLSTPVEKARSILTQQGFAMVGESHADQHSWTYKKGNVTFAFAASSNGAGLRNIAVTENASGNHFDLNPRVAEISDSWGQSTDNKPVCGSREVNGKIVVSECGVTDPTGKEAAYYALMSIVQIQQRIGLVKFD